MMTGEASITSYATGGCSRCVETRLRAFAHSHVNVELRIYDVTTCPKTERSSITLSEG